LIRIGVSGESSFWYRPTRVVPDQRPLNGRCCCLLLFMNLVLHSNFDIYMFYLVIFLRVKRLTVSVKNRNWSILMCTGCTDYRDWYRYLMTKTLCSSVTIRSGRPHGEGRGLAKVNKGSGVKDAGMLWMSFTDGPKAKT